MRILWLLNNKVSEECELPHTGIAEEIYVKSLIYVVCIIKTSQQNNKGNTLLKLYEQHLGGGGWGVSLLSYLVYDDQADIVNILKLNLCAT